MEKVINNKCKAYELFQETMIRNTSNNLIDYDKARWVLTRYRIPKWLTMPILKEMIDFGYLTRINQRALKINLD